MKKCVVSFADSTGSYQKKMLRLEQSLKAINFDGDFLGFTSYEEIGCEPHDEIPYKFKPYAIQKALDAGYESIIWCDSPIYAKKSIQPLFDYVYRYGCAFFDNIGYSLGDYTNDKTLKHFNITRAESWDIPMIMACCFAFNIDHYLYKHTYFFEHYKNLANDLYPGAWDNLQLTESKDMRVKGHRHDQSVLSAIIYKEKLCPIKGQSTFFAYESHRKVMPIADSVCLFSG